MWKIPNYVAMSETEQGAILLNLRNNQFYAINTVGREFIEWMQQHSWETAVEAISDKYRISSNQVEKDMQRFFQKLVEKELAIS